MGLKAILAEKRTWRRLQKNARHLPKDYRMVYREIQKYFLQVYPEHLTPNYQPLIDLLALFEAGSAQHQAVLELVGPDVASFADGLMHAELEPAAPGSTQATADVKLS